ncbi:MAG: hypothetical protein AAFR61_16510 [Bacteroidota bacterium]
MKRSLLITLALLMLVGGGLNAQVHLFPENGGDGIPGAAPHSYVIGWGRIQEAFAYEYVVSDNPFCFAGCAGDTRQFTVFDTAAVEYNLVPETWYYWITRAYLDNGDTTHWSLISSFLTAKPSDGSRLLKVGQNPVLDGQIRVIVDWSIDPEAPDIRLRLINMQGVTLTTHTHRRGGSLLRFEEVSLPTPPLISGTYLLQVEIGDNFNLLNNFYAEKIVVQ